MLRGAETVASTAGLDCTSAASARAGDSVAERRRTAKARRMDISRGLPGRPAFPTYLGGEPDVTLRFRSASARMKRLLLPLLLSVSPAFAQGAGMGGMTMHSALGGYAMNRDSSGTSWQPDLGPAMGRMDMAGDWMLMSRLALTGVYDTQSGPRGDEMPYLAGMAMGMAQRDFSDSWGDGTLGFR